MAGVLGWAQPQQEGKILLAQVPYALSFDHKCTARTVIMVIIIRSVSTVHGCNSIAVPREKKVGGRKNHDVPCPGGLSDPKRQASASKNVVIARAF